ncbi:MAG: hypothetical protein NC408_01415 [Candidatus Gastranaerophilales bacterium]|nr:hypothetical protein [Candidatus Gastranaerophilales bacterium]MCM1072223.1 hypothetical protein [Bacteroides sp.]
MKIQNSQIFNNYYNYKQQIVENNNVTAPLIDSKISSEAIANIGIANIALQNNPAFTGRKIIIPKEKLIELIAAGLSLSAICETLSISRPTLYAALQEHELEHPSQRGPNNKKYIPEDEFRNVHFDKTLNHAEKLTKLGISEVTYYKYCEKYNCRTEQAQKQERSKNITKDEFLAIALTDNTIQEKAKLLGIGIQKYRAMAAQYEILTDAQKRQEELDKITQQEFEAVFYLDIKKQEKCELLQITPTEFNSLAKKFKLKSKLQLQRENSQNITREQFEEVYNMPVPEKTKWAMLGINHVTYRKKALEFKLKENYNSDILDKFSEEELQEIFRREIPLNEKMEILGCKNANTYYALMARFGFQSKMQIRQAYIASFTKEQVEEILYSDLPEKDKLEKAQLTPTNYKKLLHKFGLLGEWEKLRKYNRHATKEELQNAIIHSNTITTVCKELNIDCITFHKLVNKYGINYEALLPPTQKYGKRDYDKYNYDELKDRLFYIYTNNENNISNIKEFETTIDFLFKQDNCSEFQKPLVIDFIKQLDKFEIGQIKKDEIINSESYKEIKKWIDRYYEPYELQTKMELLQDALIKAGLYHLQEICSKYSPKDNDLYDTKQIEASKSILELTEKYIDKESEDFNPKDRKDLANILTYFDLVLTEPDNELLQAAKSYCTKFYNDNSPLHVQQIINAVNMLNNNEIDEYLFNKSNLFVERINNTIRSKDKAIEFMLKLDTFFDTEESKNNILSDFCEIFNSGTVIENRMIEEFIETVYLNYDTVKTFKDSNTGREIVSILDKEGKQKLWNSTKVNFDKIDFLRDTEKYMDMLAESKANRPGIKIFTLDNGVNIAEIKISGFNGARMFATPETIDETVLIFNDFAPKGFHTNHKN